MKINIKIAIIFLFIAIISAIFIYILEIFILPKTLVEVIKNILIGILSSSIVSAAMSITWYLHEREKILNKIYINSRNLYINIYVLSKVIGHNLQQSNFSDIKDLQTTLIYNLSKLNIDFIDKMELDFFDLFFKYGILNNIYKNLSDFISNFYKIKECALNLQNVSLRYQNDILKYNQQIADSIILEKNELIIKIAKLHEYVTGQADYFEKFMSSLCIYLHGTKKWDTIKISLNNSIVSILNDYNIY